MTLDERRLQLSEASMKAYLSARELFESVLILAMIFGAGVLLGETYTESVVYH